MRAVFILFVSQQMKIFEVADGGIKILLKIHMALITHATWVSHPFILQ